ncbi:hypothetical protein [Mycobacterium kiyosense]
MIEADTVAHCGPTLIGEFARTLTMTDVVTGWTENTSIRNNASKWITEGVEGLQQRFPFPMVVFDSTAVASSSIMNSLGGCRPVTSPRPAPGRTRRTTGPMWRVQEQPRGFSIIIILHKPSISLPAGYRSGSINLQEHCRWPQSALSTSSGQY